MADSIKLKLGIEEYELFAALGWLAHEKKIYIFNLGDELYLSNKQHFENNLHFIK